MDDEYVVQMPDTQTQGYCEVCGEPASSPRGKRCAEHPRQAAAHATTNVGKRTRKGTKAPAAVGTVSARKAAGSFSKLIIIISAVWAYTAVRRYGIPDLDGTLAEELAMTDEEAADIAKPLGRVVMSNSTAARIAGPIIDNDDLIDAAFALWEWNKRMNSALAAYRPHQIQDNQRRVDVTPGPNAPSAGASGGDPTGLPQWDNGTDYRTVV